MGSYSVFFPGYTAGEDAYHEIDAVCSPYGTKAVVIGGKTAMDKTRDYLLEATKESSIKITDFVWYKGEAAFEYAEELQQLDAVKEADMVFCVGGGKAIDCAKLVADHLKKPYFTFPTIASTCACISALGIYYHTNHVFRDFFRVERPPVHVFISTRVIAEAPEVYLWAGIGDGMSKEAEVTFSARGKEEELTLSEQAGVAMSRCCTEPLLKYGIQAMEDCKLNRPSEAIEQVALDIFINTGMVSNMVDSHKYNTNLAHALFNSMTMLHQIEERHLHGEVVSYGTLVLLTLDRQYELLERYFEFYKGMKLPTKLSDIEVSVEELDPVLEATVKKYDLDYVPYDITPDMIKAAILELEDYNLRKAA
ncbi:iron-containing alcohol dehydrogenase family protein [Anaerotignum sp. MB30-C6]|uniref:iron-containing alcohol dehydrogenase family protein n=1 Tax=Anaerotignum sp. MB30-C6 TaxID=3070814 RepID=UPI0027DD38DB|nr:iron-containing alcohol dehydrogenase family protein [Anaerotignum sp. MB30-C6]WMI80875.1 iron-containing alcohol dehydrogenase family protein [Anaerotignum sp. MB30-C6]